VTKFAPHLALKLIAGKLTFDERVVLHRVNGVGGRLSVEERALDSLTARYTATWAREFKFPWREAGPPNHLDDQVDSDQ